MLKLIPPSAKRPPVPLRCLHRDVPFKSMLPSLKRPVIGSLLFLNATPPKYSYLQLRCLHRDTPRPGAVFTFPHIDLHSKAPQPLSHPSVVVTTLEKVTQDSTEKVASVTFPAESPEHSTGKANPNIHQRVNKIMKSKYTSLVLTLSTGAVVWMTFLSPVRSIQRLAESVPDLGALEPDAVAAHLEELLVAITPDGTETRPGYHLVIAQAGPEVVMATCNEMHDIANGPDLLFVKFWKLLYVAVNFRNSRLAKIPESTGEQPWEQRSKDYPPLQQ
ncbi:hypothetical protein C8F04DRAFT_1072905, partial [Mycena alexandri]